MKSWEGRCCVEGGTQKPFDLTLDHDDEEEDVDDKDFDQHPMLRRKAVDSRRGRRTMSTSLCIIIWKTTMMTI